METPLIHAKIWAIVLLLIWVLPWKGYALWTAANRKQKWWFIAILVINTFAILEIIYVFWVAKKTPKDIVDAFKRHTAPIIPKDKPEQPKESEENKDEDKN